MEVRERWWLPRRTLPKKLEAYAVLLTAYKFFKGNFLASHPRYFYILLNQTKATEVYTQLFISLNYQQHVSAFKSHLQAKYKSI
jgi:hypothetical protein